MHMRATFLGAAFFFLGQYWQQACPRLMRRLLRKRAWKVPVKG